MTQILTKVDAYFFRVVPRLMMFLARTLLLMGAGIGWITFTNNAGWSGAALTGLVIGLGGLHYAFALSLRRKRETTAFYACSIGGLSIFMNIGTPGLVAGVGASSLLLTFTYALVAIDVILAVSIAAWAIHHSRIGTFHRSAA